MSPSFAVKKGMRYRYYVSTALVQGRRSDAGSVSRVSGSEIEKVVLQALTSSGPPLSDATTNDQLASVIERITLRSGGVEILVTQAADGAANPITVDWSPQPFRRKRAVIAATDQAGSRPIRAEARSRLLQAIAQARRWLDDIMAGAAADIDAIAIREAISPRSARMTLSLAFLAPDIVEAAADGTLPRGFGLSRLTELPPSWHKQRRALGIS